MWWLAHHPELAMETYNRVFMPLGLHFQKTLQVCPGTIDTSDVDEILLVCRKRPSA
jgi:hypothetical protein